MYSRTFFEQIRAGALRSADLIVPIVVDLIKPSSVIDVGCGQGAWLQVFWENGVKEVQGIDGDYVDRNALLIPDEYFTAADLSKPFELRGRYDMALCLEVAEHLPPNMAPKLIEQLTAIAPLVLFSAALPGQCGVNHVNEQPPSYWRTLFEQHEFALLDPIRPAILADQRIEWWYRQNLVAYAAESMIARLPILNSYRMPPDALGVEWVHAHIWAQAIANRDQATANAQSWRKMCRQLPVAVWNSIERKLGGNSRSRNQRSDLLP
jgi:SAM-dependent methyltransferase